MAWFWAVGYRSGCRVQNNWVQGAGRQLGEQLLTRAPPAPAQTVLIIGVVAKLASMAVRWEYDHAGSHLARRHASRNRLRREFEVKRVSCVRL